MYSRFFRTLLLLEQAYSLPIELLQRCITGLLPVITRQSNPEIIEAVVSCFSSLRPDHFVNLPLDWFTEAATTLRPFVDLCRTDLMSQAERLARLLIADGFWRSFLKRTFDKRQPAAETQRISEVCALAMEMLQLVLLSSVPDQVSNAWQVIQQIHNQILPQCDDTILCTHLQGLPDKGVSFLELLNQSIPKFKNSKHFQGSYRSISSLPSTEIFV